VSLEVDLATPHFFVGDALYIEYVLYGEDTIGQIHRDVDWRPINSTCQLGNWEYRPGMYTL